MTVQMNSEIDLVMHKPGKITFGGIQKCSLIDYPGKLSCVLFTRGCNFRCPYCHNPELVHQGLQASPARAGLSTPENNYVFTFLQERRSFLDAVVISGGEPTLQPGLLEFCMQVKSMGYLVKLDTNGSRPEVLQDLIQQRVVDYVAMDIKSRPSDYSLFTKQRSISDVIKRSIKIIIEQCKEYEFRTTCLRPIIERDVVVEIAKVIEGARLYVLQNFRHEKVLRPEFFKGGNNMLDQSEMEQLKSVAEPWVKRCIIR